MFSIDTRTYMFQQAPANCSRGILPLSISSITCLIHTPIISTNIIFIISLFSELVHIPKEGHIPVYSLKAGSVSTAFIFFNMF